MYARNSRAGSNPNCYHILVDRTQLPLPYWKYDEENHVYHMDDGGLSIIFECKAYGGKVAESGLITAMSRLPEDATMQVLLFPSKNITKIVDKWKSNIRDDDDLFKLVGDNYASLLESKTNEVVSPNMRCLVSDYKLIISINIGGRTKEFSIFDKMLSMVKTVFAGHKNSQQNPLETGKEDDSEIYAKNFKQICDISSGVQAALEKGNLYPKLMDPDSLIDIIFSFLNPNHDFRQIPKLQHDDNISDQMVANDTVFHVADDHFTFDGVFARSLSIKDYPHEWDCGLAEHLIGNPFGIQCIESNMALCLNIMNTGKKGADKVKWTSQIVQSQQLPQHLFPRLGMKQRDLALANYELERGKSIFHVNLAIMVFGKDYDSLNNVCSQIQAYYQQLGFIIQEDRYINLPILLSMLPGNYDVRFKNDLKRGRVVFLENAVDLAPTAADWGGNTAEPVSIFLTPRGQLFSFDLFKSNTNYNAFIIGTSGAGKSVEMQYIAMSYLLQKAKVYIIDIGGSYKNFIEIIGGQYIDVKMNPENPKDVICLNPFSELTTQALFDEYAEFLTDLYWLMGSPAEPTKALEEEKVVKAYIAKALKMAYAAKGCETNVDEVINCFHNLTHKNNDQRCKDFAQVMSIYASDGLYGGFLNGHANIKFKANTVALEVGSMEQIPNLRNPILMLLTFHISKSIYLSTDLTQKNIVMIDECHKFLGDPRTDIFIEQAVRRYRKHNAALIIGTQGWEDLDNKSCKAGRVIIENSAFQIFMKQSPASREKLKNSENHNFNEYEKAMIDSVDSIRGEFSEAVIIHDKVKVKVRLVLDDFMKRIFFTTPTMRAWINARKKEGMSLADALNSIPPELIKQ